MPTLGSVTSSDLQNWSGFSGITNGNSNYGLAMTVYRGELVGIMTQSVEYPQYMFANKWTPGSGWAGTWISLPGNWRALGRVSVTVLNDRFYLLYRGADEAMWLSYTYDLRSWTDLGRVPDTTTKTSVAPAIAAYQGKLYVVGAGRNNGNMSWCSLDGNGRVVTPWTSDPGCGTDAALALCVHRNVLYLLHKGLDGRAFYSQSLNEGTWSTTTKVVANITYGVAAASLADGTMLVTYKGDNANVKYHIFTEGSGWGGQQTVARSSVIYEHGCASFNGLAFISYASNSSTGVAGYEDRFLVMDEKATHDEDDQEWKCKWDENSGSDGKSWVRKTFCM